MMVDFLSVLTVLTLLSGAIYLIDILLFARKRLAIHGKMPIIIDYARSFFPVLLIVLIIRSFLIQPFRVPSPSLEPTVQPGDFVAVSQFSYGLRLPLLYKKIVKIGEPKRGDIAVFRYPPNPSINFVKRVIGLPGDHVVYKNKQLIINNKLMPQQKIREEKNLEIRQENLEGIKHLIQIQPHFDPSGDYDVVVPKGHYFMMGDNRDGSADSRFWGFLPEENLVGKAFIVWFNWDSRDYKFHWSRMGTRL